MEGKIPCIEVRRPESHPGLCCTWKFSKFDIHSEMDDSDVGDMVQLTYVELTEQEIETLGEFDGW